jgi:hypothetical protein
VVVRETDDAVRGPAGVVVRQMPSEGTPLPPSSTVTLVVRSERAVPPTPPPREGGVNREWWAFVALILALSVGVLTVRYGQRRRRRRREGQIA